MEEIWSCYLVFSCSIFSSTRYPKTVSWQKCIQIFQDFNGEYLVNGHVIKFMLFTFLKFMFCFYSVHYVMLSQDYIMEFCNGNLVMLEFLLFELIRTHFPIYDYYRRDMVMLSSLCSVRVFKDSILWSYHGIIVFTFFVNLKLLL